ncbi:MAG: hypothetical protein ACKPHU_15795, partial [Planctomycetaceae bacterium]
MKSGVREKSGTDWLLPDGFPWSFPGSFATLLVCCDREFPSVALPCSAATSILTGSAHATAVFVAC